MFETTKDGDSFVIKPETRLTATNAEAFRALLLAAVERGERDIVIDLEQVDMIDSRGLAVFIVGHRALSELSGKLRVICDNEDLRTLFRLMRLDEHFAVNARS